MEFFLLTTVEAGEVIGVERTLINELMVVRELPTVRIVGSIRVPHARQNLVLGTTFYQNCRTRAPPLGKI